MWSGRAEVLVDAAAEHASAAHGGLEVDDDGRVVFGWVLIAALMWTVPVEVPFVFS